MNYGIKPDIVSMAKAMGGGMPIGAICATEEVSKAFTMGSHGTTFGGHPVCCAASLAAVTEIIDRDLPGNAKKVGAYFIDKLSKLPHVKEARARACSSASNSTAPSTPSMSSTAASTASC